VVEVNRPDRARRRRKGKTDPVDAEVAARAVLAGDARAVPKDRNGAVGQLRALVVARRSAVKARTQATNQLRALLVDGDDELRGRLRPLRKAHLARACAQLAPTAGLRLALAAWAAAGWPSTTRSPTWMRPSPSCSGAPRPGCWNATASACRPPPSC
jgi:transposase